MRIHKTFLIFSVAAVTALAGIAGFHVNLTQAAEKKAVYYCPMHPTYTSDRPGDCPICNMKLVKKEEGQKKQDICYLHNCPHEREGKPCPMLVVAKEGEKVECPLCKGHVAPKEGEKAEKKILYWTDPMIPGYKSDQPGKSPMGMDLVPVYEEAGGAAPTGPIPEGYAPVFITPQKQQFIGIKTSKVERRKLTKTIRAVGTIAHDPELYQAQTEYIQAVEAYERAQKSNIPEIADQSRRLVESSRIRLKHMGLNDELIAEIAERKEAQQSLLFSGSGEPVWVYASVYEYELPLIRMGQDIKAEVPSFADKIFRGSIRAVDPVVDQMTRTVRVRAKIQDPEGLLKPQMYVNVSIDVDLGEGLSLPAEAVFDTGTKKIVFVDKGRGLFEPRDVTVGAQMEGYYELKSGVGEGESVVTSGNFLIDSESRLKAAFEGMTGAGGHQHGE